MKETYPTHLGNVSNSSGNFSMIERKLCGNVSVFEETFLTRWKHFLENIETFPDEARYVSN